MKSRFKKFLLSLLCLGGMFAMAGCQSASHTASVPTSQCEVKVYQQAGESTKTALVTLGIDNNTIYNVREIHLTYQVYKETMEKMGDELEDDLPLFVRHGLTGYVTYTVKVNKTDAAFVKITKTAVTKYDSLWDTYLSSFIVMFVISGVALIFSGVEIFARGLTREQTKAVFKEKLASSLTILALVLLLCMVPLFFSSWVVTLILLGGFAGTILLTGGMTLIKLAFTK